LRKQCMLLQALRALSTQCLVIRPNRRAHSPRPCFNSYHYNQKKKQVLCICFRLLTPYRVFFFLASLTDFDI
jgi:hypothetical protein